MGGSAIGGGGEGTDFVLRYYSSYSVFPLYSYEKEKEVGGEGILIACVL